MTLNTNHTCIKIKTIWKNNTNNYTIDDYRSEIVDLKQQHTENYGNPKTNTLEIWQKLKNQIKKLLIKQAQKQSVRQQLERTKALQHLMHLKDKMTEHPTKDNFEEYKKCQRQMYDAFITNARNNLLKSKSTFEDYRNIALHTLYKEFSPQKQQTNINKIVTPTNKVISQPQMINKSIRDFYESLYGPPKIDLDTQTDFITKIDTKLDAQHQNSIGKPLTEYELDAAVKDLKKGKSPGPDGLSSEFYKEFFPQIKKTLLDALNYVYCNNVVNEKFVEGVITLIHKKDEIEKIENYRPITLLNIDYKILNKILNTDSNHT